MDKLISVKTFANEIGLAEITIRQWIQKGLIKSHKIGVKSRRIPVSELKRIIDERGIIKSLIGGNDG